MNEYHIYEELGKGKKSIVYKGRKHKSIEYVAVKSVDRDQMDKVLHEVQVMYRLKHPNILRFFNWYETRNHIWLILEYCTGGDLLQLLTQDAHMPERALKVLGVDLLAGLHHLHTLGILYCDLKPSNVLVDEFGVLKLCDFGLAREFPTLNKDVDGNNGPRRGTPCYMAPELFAEDGVYSTASDLWSLGCVLYELAVGSPPFVSNDFEELVEMIVWSEAPLSHRYTLEKSKNQVTLSLQFQDLLHGLLQKQPEDRLKWDQVLKHPFWDPRLAPKPQPLPNEELYNMHLKKRLAAKAKSHARSASVMDSRNNKNDDNNTSRSSTTSSSSQNIIEEDGWDIIQEDSNLGNESNYTTNSEWDGNETSKTTFVGEFEMSDIVSASKENKKQRRGGSNNASGVDIMRLSRIVRENMENEKSNNGYDDRKENTVSNTILATADTEVDFIDNSKGRSEQQGRSHEESLGDEIEDDDSREEELLGVSNHLEDDEDSNDDKSSSMNSSSNNYDINNNRHGAVSPHAFVSRSTSRSIKKTNSGIEEGDTEGDEKKKNNRNKKSPSSSSSSPPQSSNSQNKNLLYMKNNNNNTQQQRYESNERYLLQLILDGVPVTVSPISGNRSIETPTQLTFKTSSLPFKPESVKTVMKMQQEDLESFLTKIYRGLSGKARTVSEKMSILGYFTTICTPTRIANLIVNSSVMRLLVKLARKHSTSPNIRSAISKMMSTLFRHATFIASDMADDGVLHVLVEMVRDRHPTVRRAAMAALGELLFYITTEDQDDNDPQSPNKPEDDNNNAWIVPGNVISLIDRVLRVNGSTTGNGAMGDDIVQHYATKTLQNMFAQGTSNQVARFATQEIALHLRDAIRGGRNDAHRVAAMTALALLLRRNPKVLHKIVDKATLKYILSHFSDMRSRTLQPGLTIMNLVLYHGRHMSNNIKQVRNMLVSSPRILNTLTKCLENAPKQGNVKGQVLVSLRLLLDNNPVFIAACCNGKLSNLLLRLSPQISANIDVNPYVYKCFKEFTNFLAKSVTSSLELIASRIQNVKTATDDSPVRYSTFVANDQIEGAVVILPSLLSLINSPLLLENLCHAPLAINISKVLLHLQSMMSDEWDDIRRVLFVLLEAFSHNAKLLLHPGQQRVVVRALLPSLVQWLDSSNGNIRVLFMKISCDILMTLFQGISGKFEDQLEDENVEELSHGVRVFIENEMLPMYKIIIKQEEPVPQYALKILCAALDYDRGYVHAILEYNLLRDVIRCLYTRTRVGEGEMSVSTHAAKVLCHIVKDGEAKIEDLHRLDVSNQLCKAILSALREGVEPSYDPLVDVLYVILKHANQIVAGNARGNSSGNLVSDLHVLEVKESCEDFLALDFLDALKQLIQNGRNKRRDYIDDDDDDDEYHYSRMASKCMSLLEDIFGNRLKYGK